MAKYLRLFQTTAEYTTAESTLDKPNVSYIVETNGVAYKQLRNDIITYTAKYKLTETTSSSSSGLHTNAFNTTIKSHTFENGVGAIEFNANVTSIGNYAFVRSSLTSITIPNSVTSIGNNAFLGCLSLTSITIPDSVTSIGNEAFYQCTVLTSVTLGNSVTSIGEQAFQNCWSLTSITIPDSVTSIGNEAFSNCSDLTSVTLGDGVTSIGNQAFYKCSSLTSITISNSVTSIGNFPFSGCSGLTSIVVDSGNSTYDSRNNCNAIIETATNKLITGCQNTVIPNTVTSIGNGAFYICTGLTSITIPNSVTSIGMTAFAACSGLTSVTSLAITAPTIDNSTFRQAKTGGTLYVSTGSTGYDTWMNYLPNGWTMVEQ